MSFDYKKIFNGLESHFSREPVEIPEIWQEIHDLWRDFHDGPSKYLDWEKSENLDGLVSGLSPESLQEAIYTLEGFGLWRHLPPEAGTIFLTSFISGIRVGNALAVKRAKEVK